ncbi:MAG TPA: SRPBCC family protein [Chitinophaga sp.]|uniref:SRPBCC family protein n=1 Tax=Chitinophaga sp. TaxID=1869181 RepID=UPI002DBE399A|nr:SRPBCC family protein [Chitinophaga sp.]HEU4554040.1 SRPBCC family protein [Chitinophaga sp.]
MTENENKPFAKASMLIRKPVAAVFDAIVNPDVITKFWFTHSSGPLAAGQQVTWTWGMFNLSVPVTVKTVTPHQEIVMEWGNGKDVTQVTWTFKTLEGKGTYVTVVNDGFKGNAGEVLAAVRGSTEGFTLVLAGAKAYLEHGIQLNLVADKFPEGVQ